MHCIVVAATVLADASGFVDNPLNFLRADARVTIARQGGGGGGGGEWSPQFAVTIVQLCELEKRSKNFGMKQEFFLP